MLSEFSLPEEILRLESIDCQIPLDAIYAKVKLRKRNRLRKIKPGLDSSVRSVLESPPKEQRGVQA